MSVSPRRAVTALVTSLGALLSVGCGDVAAESARREPPPPAFSVKRSELRPTEGGAMPPRFEAGETVESFASVGGAFRVHFTRSGPNGVPAADTNANGTPDFVEQVAATYDEVLAFFVSMGFDTPPSDATLPAGSNGGDGRFDVYLVDFAGRADGSYRLDACASGGNTGCTGHMLQENDFFGYSYPSTAVANRILASHELFHAVQAGYDAELGTVASEGTAVWASERFDPSLSDFESFATAYLERTDRSLTIDPVGPVQSFAYGSAIFFQFLSERLGDGVVRAMWEASRTSDARWPVLLDERLKAEQGLDFPTVFREFSLWNLFTGARADTSRSYAAAASYSEVPSTSLPFPANEDGVRVALAAARHFDIAATPGGDGKLWATFAPTDGTTDGLTVIVAALDGAGRVMALGESMAGGEGPPVASVPMTGAASGRVVIIDGRFEGNGRFGRVCAGDEAALTSCGTDGSGPGDSPPPSDRGDSGDGEDGGGCTAGGGGVELAVMMLLAAFGLPRRTGRVDTHDQDMRRG